MINLDVTAPGATLALGLMFLKTNDAAAASRLTVPSTQVGGSGLSVCVSLGVTKSSLGDAKSSPGDADVPSTCSSRWTTCGRTS
jgi:hypothetical protein